jgi:CDP-glucose 4,6-dehydratase
MVMKLPAPSFWHNRRVFLTGHTGFKGGWLALWLQQLGAKVAGYALEPSTNPSLYRLARVGDGMTDCFGDIRNLPLLTKEMQAAEPEIVIHLAAQPLVRASYKDPVDTFSSNVLGTVHLFEAVRATSSVRAVLNITSDKCYANQEWPWGYRENDPIGGHDPYSCSKGCAELVTSSYYKSFFKEQGVGLASARAGNVIGGGDWSADRIVPDTVHAFTAGQQIVLRNPMATRPWQHVLEPLAGYLLLCQRLYEEPDRFSEGWNFGPYQEDVCSVSELVALMAKHWGGNTGWEQDKGAHPHEAHYLKLDCSKAHTQLGWKPVWRMQQAVRETVDWYAQALNEIDMQAYTLEQIATYQDELKGQQDG